MRRGIYLLVFLLLSGVVAADEGIQISEVTSRTILQPDELGQYVLQITNLGSDEYQLQIGADPYAGLASSDFVYVLVEPSLVTIKGHESAEVTVDIKLKDDVVRQKRYKTYVTVKSIGNSDVNEQYDLQVFAMEPKDPITMYISDAPESVAPGSTMLFTLNLLNNLNEDLSNVDIYVSSDLFEDKQTVQLFADQERGVELSYPISRQTAPQSYSYNVRVYYEDELRATASGAVVIQENSDVAESVDTITGFLFKEIKITKTNNGNANVETSYSYAPGMIQGWFSFYSADPTSTDAGALWVFDLEPGEGSILTITVDYRPVVIGLVVLLLLGVISYFLFTKRVTVKKDVFRLEYGAHGLSHFRVQVHIKNNTSKPISDINLVDKIQTFMQPHVSFGTMHPSGQERGAKDTRYMWKIPELVNGEERIISYNVTCGTPVIGELRLLHASAKYKNKRGRSVAVSSNAPKVSSGGVEPEEKETEKE